MQRQSNQWGRGGGRWKKKEAKLKPQKIRIQKKWNFRHKHYKKCEVIIVSQSVFKEFCVPFWIKKIFNIPAVRILYFQSFPFWWCVDLLRWKTTFLKGCIQVQKWLLIISRFLWFFFYNSISKNVVLVFWQTQLWTRSTKAQTARGTTVSAFLSYFVCHTVCNQSINQISVRFWSKTLVFFPLCLIIIILITKQEQIYLKKKKDMMKLKLLVLLIVVASPPP